MFGVATTILWDDGEAELRLGGGARLSEWIEPMQDTLSEWARTAGADRLTILGRKGWARFAKRFGWVALGTDGEGRFIFKKGLNNGRSSSDFYVI